MWRLLPTVLLLLSFPIHAFAYSAIACGALNDQLLCGLAPNAPTPDQAATDAYNSCINRQGQFCRPVGLPFTTGCRSVYGNAREFHWQDAPDFATAQTKALQGCESIASCESETQCTFPIDPFSTTTPVVAPPPREVTRILIVAVIGLSIVFFLIVQVSTKPRSAPDRSSKVDTQKDMPADIAVLFRHSQRMSALGRGIFMLDVRLGASASQLERIRRYRLEKIIVYDSARRQKRNELARTHLLLAAQPGPASTTAQGQIMGLLRSIYYLIRAFFSWLASFLFIRIRLGSLINGAHIESKNLWRVLEVEQAVKTTAEYLKQYLDTAATFDGREELFEPE